MEREGVVQNGVIVPNGDCPLPDGTKVLYRPSESAAEESLPTLGERLRRLAERFEAEPCDLPSDLSINHDHYLYGTPKRQP